MTTTNRIAPEGDGSAWRVPEELAEWVQTTLRAAGVAAEELAVASLRLSPAAENGGWELELERVGASDPTVAELPPRLRRVMVRLLSGDSEKQVAGALGLSRHTVHEYIKQLYRRLGVASRPELMARFVAA